MIGLKIGDLVQYAPANNPCLIYKFGIDAISSKRTVYSIETETGLFWIGPEYDFKLIASEHPQKDNVKNLIDLKGTFTADEILRIYEKGILR